MRVLLASLACVAAFHASVPAVTETEAVTLTVMTGARSLPPGGVVLVTMRASRPLTELEGRAFGRPVWFWSDADRTKWHGLIAAGLDAKPGPYTATATGSGPSGMATATLSLHVEPKQFQTRRLTVDPQFVNPPDAEAERIGREVKQMAEVFGHITPERLWRGAFELPVPGEATSSFGRLSVLNGESRGRHQGADFRAVTGTPVHAPNGGRVALASDLYFSGNTVIIDHGLGMFSLLAHFSKLSVETGATVSRGQVIGESGATGRVTGPHLHWALRLGEASVDPLALVRTVSRLSDEH
ncbi:MAG TPA: M23 family metallopeptidase [Vicinamibacterales bacterium]|jgi:murein DD-endopeptidase MepM/ murein hydrolase activator NlpD